MSDPVSAVSGMVSITQGALQFLDFVRGVAGSEMISELFKWDTTLVEGSEKINVNIQYDSKAATKWWYWVDNLEDYTFVRFPVVSSCLAEVPGQDMNNGQTTEAQYWRWVPQTVPGRIVGGDSSNVKVDFIVIGYRPKALLKHFSS